MRWERLSGDKQPRYGTAMASLWKLLTLLAVLLMPFGMSSAHATAEHHGPTASMPMEHCPDQGSKPDQKGGIAECTMACASALPAVTPAPGEVMTFTPLVCSARLVETLHGLNPEIATPPPKHS